MLDHIIFKHQTFLKDLPVTVHFTLFLKCQLSDQRRLRPIFCFRKTFHDQCMLFITLNLKKSNVENKNSKHAIFFSKLGVSFFLLF